jgi:hypothetical protein
MILKEEIEAALKDRIGRDMGFQLAKGWDKKPLGEYYFSTDPATSEIVIERVVGEVLNGILSAHSSILSNAAWGNLFAGIDGSTKPEDAIVMMFAAAGTSVPMPHSTPLFLRAEPPKQKRR